MEYGIDSVSGGINSILQNRYTITYRHLVEAVPQQLNQLRAQLRSWGLEFSRRRRESLFSEEGLMLAEIQLKPENYSKSSRAIWESLSPTRTKRLPTMYELPSESPEDGMLDQFQVIQLQFLSETFCPPSYPADRVFMASDLYFYYDSQNPTRYKRPAWFAVLGVPAVRQQQELRLSYLLWQERVVPYVIVELLSPGTEKEDLGKTVPGQPPRKRDVYEQWLKVPYYLVYSRYTNELQAYQLVNGQSQSLAVTGQGVWLSRAQLGIGVWSGEYQRVTGLWLRCYNGQGQWIPTTEETTEAVLRWAKEQRDKEAASQQFNQLRAQLRDWGIELKV